MNNRIITRDELCEATGMPIGSLRKVISRKNIIEVKKDCIDLDNEINKIYILTYSANKGIDIEPILYGNGEVKSDEKPEIKKPDAKKSKTKLSHVELQQLKTEKEVEKLEVETRLKNLELEKKKAKVLPLDFVIDWSALNIRGIFGETVNFGNSIIEQICNELDADIEIKLKFKKQFKQGFNEILKAGIKNQKPEAVAQAKEYSLLTKW
ncbi:MAG: hypothetical protein QNK20_14470 [Aureibaculum sp.]|nr:hypothetical protein [Aureibaculum sp.]